MSQTQTQESAAPAPAPETPKTIPAELLKRVQRPKVEDGKPVTETKTRKVGGKVIEEQVPVLRPIEADEVFAWAASEEQVVVVTRDGQKFTAERGG